MTVRSVLPALFCAAALPAFAQEAPPAAEPDPEAAADAARDALVAKIEEAWKANLESCADTNRWFVAKGVLADRESGTVRVDAWTTGIAPGAVCEFFLITLNSGHDYEAVLQTSAFAGDVAAAFEFLGVPAGKGIDPRELRFWSRGELVDATVSVDGKPAMPLVELVSDRKTGVPKPWRDFRYVGGFRLDDGSNAVDSQGPGSIVPDYNEPVTLFDIPSMAFQSDVYESNVASTNCSFGAFVPAVVTFAPEKRVPPLSPRRVAEDGAVFDPKGFLYYRSDAPGAEAPTVVPPAVFVQDLSKRVRDEKRDVFLSFQWTPEVALAALKNAAMLLQALDKDETGVRLDVPPEGFPYYKALLPREDWRDRSKRYSQPCELRFAAGEDGAFAATLVAIEEKWEDDALQPELLPKEFPVAAPGDLPALLAAKGPRDLPVVLVFVPGGMTWADFKPWYDAFRSTHPQVQIFVD